MINNNVVLNTTDIIESLKYNVNSFRETLTIADILSITNSEYVVLDLETTGLTAYDKPTTVTKSSKIGPELTWGKYKQIFGGDINCSLRVRIFGVALSNGRKLAFDFDKLTEDQKISLATVTLDNKIVIGQNLTFDLAWLQHYTKAQPRYLLDTMLIARCIKPGMFLTVYNKAHDGELDTIKVAMKINDGSASLETLSVAAGLDAPEKSYQHPRNWCVSNLSQEHVAYVMSDIEAPIDVLMYILRMHTAYFDINLAMHNLRMLDQASGGSYNKIYSKVPLIMSEMHAYGMPVKTDVVESVAQNRVDRIPALVEEFIQLVPAAEEFRRNLSGLATSMPQGLKDIIGQYLAEHGFDLTDEEDTDKFVLNSKAVKLSGASALPGWQAWQKLQKAKKELQFAIDFDTLSVETNVFGYKRIHPMISVSAVTCRTTSKNPNSQNLPRPDADLEDGLQIRTCVTARPGYMIVSADYGQIELRIAGALAVRAYKETLNALKTQNGLPAWFIETLNWAESDEVITAPTASAEERSFDDYKAEIAIAWRAVKAKGMVMAEIFRNNIDPHLATGLGMAIKQQIVAIKDEPIAYLKSVTKEAADALKKQIKAQRQSAKALNFGLLYGMGAYKLWTMGITDYNLNWTAEEAVSARLAWFDMFADIKWWQIYEGVARKVSKQDALSVYRRNGYTKEMERTEVRPFVTSTLIGRPVAVLEKRECLNYCDQGTGADIALLAMVEMNKEIRQYAFNIVHDEIMLEVPEEIVEEAQKELQRAMLFAADYVLREYDIPAEADPGCSTFWKKD